MPMLMTLRMRLPCGPAVSAHAVTEVRHLVEHGVHLGHTFSPSTTIRCRAARGHVQDRAGFVMLILSPRNMASMRAQVGLLGPLQEG